MVEEKRESKSILRNQLRTYEKQLEFYYKKLAYEQKEMEKTKDVIARLNKWVFDLENALEELK